MNTPLPFFNWSLKKALDVSPDNFTRARINIIFTILIISLVKTFVVIGTGYWGDQPSQLIRAVIAMLLYVVLIKLLLYLPLQIRLYSHLMLLAGLLIVVSSLFIYTHTINLLTVQFVFMMILCSFYTLGSKWGIGYSIAGVLPIAIFLALPGSNSIYGNPNDKELISPGFEILAVLNFVSILLAHYFFYRAFDSNVKEKEQLNEQLRLSVAKANRLAASRSDFLSTMSHELRTPLNSVIGITELLLLDKPEERQKENLKILQSSSHDLLSLINNVLDINKIDSEKMELEMTPFDLSVLIRNICSGLRVKAEDKQLQLQLNIDDQLENLLINSDPTRLSQVIYNLAGNAIKFTSTGRVNIQLKCLEKKANSVDVLFSISDTGVGIHPDRHAAVFETFTQAESHTTRNFGGSGLGLSIVKQVLNLFGSVIQLESSLGSGSTFSFVIKFDTATNAAITIPSKDERPSLEHLKLLIAEDNDINKMIIRKQLNNLNIFPVIVDNGEEAYKANLADTFDAIFIDLHMPVMNGYETAKQIRASSDAKKSTVFLVAFTASVTEQQHILDTGFDDFLYKPVSTDELRKKLERIASNHRRTS
jgi:two-component system, sensor histidine kinase